VSNNTCAANFSAHKGLDQSSALKNFLRICRRRSSTIKSLLQRFHGAV
jgi:hypothetical protein